MMDWVRLLEDYKVEFAGAGKNTRKGEISIQCPFCGEDDPSHHMGISLNHQAWGCLRDVSHRGVAPTRLVMAILGCSSYQAKLVIQQYSHSDPDDLASALASLERGLNPAMVTNQMPPGPPPGEFHRIYNHGTSMRFWKYLQGRGYDNPKELIELFGLRCCTSGAWKDRIIIPIHMHYHHIGWQGRALTDQPKLAPRYLSSSPQVKASIFGFDSVVDSYPIFITEGPFDAMKIMMYSSANAVATFGTAPTREQLALLAILVSKRPKTQRKIVLFDEGALGHALELSQWIGGEVGHLPDGVQDPGKMTRAMVAEFTAGYK